MGDRIVAVGRGLEADGAVVTDAAGMIVMPGFVDSHRHIWEGVLRNIGTDIPLEGRSSYLSHVLHKLAPAFRPEDAYMGNLLSAVGAIDAGITTLLDWSHIQASPDHTDAAIQALEDSGMRAVFAYGFPWWGKWDERQPSWFVRAATEHFASQDQMVTLALAAPGPEFTDFEVTRDHWRLAHEAGPGSRPTSASVPTASTAKFEQFGRGRRTRSRHHLHPLHDAQRHRDPDDRRHRRHRVAGDAGRNDDGSRHATDSEVPRPGSEAEPQRRRGDERPERHVQPDAIGAHPAAIRWRRVRARRRSPLETCCEYATIEGARANGLDAKVGSLTPGKKADIIMLRTDRMNVTPLNDPATAVVTSMDTGNVDTVMIGGRVMKQSGQLLHVDWPALRRLATDSRDFVIAKSGYKLPKI